jgi:hypothetical protein
VTPHSGSDPLGDLIVDSLSPRWQFPNTACRQQTHQALGDIVKPPACDPRAIIQTG